MDQVGDGDIVRKGEAVRRGSHSSGSGRAVRRSRRRRNRTGFKGVQFVVKSRDAVDSVTYHLV